MSELIVIGHRGAASLAPENTLPSFDVAQKLNVQMIELDVHMSKDMQLIVIHDETLNRTTSGRGPVGAHTLAQLKTLDAGVWFKPEFRGSKIPTLEEVYAALPKHIGINVEIKTDVTHYPGIEAKVLNVVQKFHALHRTIVSSFNWESLTLMHRLEPKLKLGILMHHLEGKVWPMAGLIHAFSLHPPQRLVSSNFVWQAHSWGYKVYPWVVNDPGRVLKLGAMGVDGVITDCPQIITHYWE
ncbi:MAG: glycerophosphodiester phosphodiesterase [Peptococcaceae bacterium]|nr:glycerophosphodiester phosphodiesterase [Peptococcaceae bacterium]